MSLFTQKPLWSNPENIVAQLRRFIGLDDAALALVRKHAAVLGAQADELSSHFYNHLLAHAETASAFAATPPERMHTLMARQAEHFRRLLSDWPDSAQRTVVKTTRIHYSHGVSPTWIIGAYNIYREHLEARLADVPAADRDALRHALNGLLFCDMMLQTAALENVTVDTLTERAIIIQTLLETTLKLADLPTPEDVFASICTDLVSHSRHLPGVWFTLLEDRNAPLRPLFGSGTPEIWRNVEVPYAADDPLWRAIDENRNYVINAQAETRLPAWWPDAKGIEAAAIFPFGRNNGKRGIGVVYADSPRHFERVGLESFSAFAKLGQALLGIRENQLRDPLTGLPNRTLFMDRLKLGQKQSQRRQKLLGIGMIDLDDFKGINDKHGHLSGDDLLQQVATRLGAHLRQGDTLARLGGDEFGLLMIDLNDLAEVEIIIHRMLEALEMPFLLEDRNIRIGASLGLTLYPLDDADSQELLRHADIALYQAKDAGRHTYRIFEYASEEQQRRITSLQRRFEQALSDDEIEFHYQPKVDLARGRITGVEALARWRRSGTLLQPDAFIGAVEDSAHLSRRLGRCALFAAARQIELWRAQNIDLGVSVNIGAEHLLCPAFVEDIDEVLASHPMTAARLELEITERAALHDLARTRTALQACRERGLSIALDDYGTGHASLTYLQELPANQIKLDKRFVQRLLDEPRALAIIAGSLTSASLLDLDVIAEGVETIEQGELLLQLGCRNAQGYLIAHPMPAAELPQWLAHWRSPNEWTQWNENLFTQQDLPFLMARTAHRSNLQALLHALSSPPTAEQPFLQVPECVDETHCALGRWLRGAGQRYRAMPAFDQLTRLHSKMHGQAIETTLAWQSSDQDVLKRQIEQLHHTAHRLDREILELARQIGLHEIQQRRSH